ncbi:MAG: hypothetical protein RLZZ123_2547 [Pseudomonadota bacterium]|jgi:sugar lactone lactonase YvrE
MKNQPPKAGHAAGPQKIPEAGAELRLASSTGHAVQDMGKGSLAQVGQRVAQGATPLGHTPEPLGLKRRHFMGTALALDAAVLLAACGGGGGGGDSGAGSGSGSSSGSASSSASSSGSASSSASSSNSASSSGSGSGSAAPTQWVVSTFAGTGSNLALIDGTGGTATFNSPYGVAVDTSGHVYVTDYLFYRIRKISPAGVVSTLAGSGALGNVNGTGATAKFDGLWGVTVDTSGHLFVSETVNSDLRTITPTGVVSTLVGGVASGFLDGTGTGAQFIDLRGLAIDASGNLFVADTSNQRIRKVTPTGVVSTVAGSGASGSADGVGTLASFRNPYGVAVDAAGVVYVAENTNHMIRKITPAGVVTTLAGTGVAGSANGTGTNASFTSPRGLAVDASGAVYVADYGNHLIRKITSEGVVSTLAGTGIRGSANGVGTLASFNNPTGIALDGSGHLWVADASNHMIRKITPV